MSRAKSRELRRQQSENSSNVVAPSNLFPLGYFRTSTDHIHAWEYIAMDGYAGTNMLLTHPVKGAVLEVFFGAISPKVGRNFFCALRSHQDMDFPRVLQEMSLLLLFWLLRENQKYTWLIPALCTWFTLSCIADIKNWVLSGNWVVNSVLSQLPQSLTRWSMLTVFQNIHAGLKFPWRCRKMNFVWSCIHKTCGLSNHYRNESSSTPSRYVLSGSTRPQAFNEILTCYFT